MRERFGTQRKQHHLRNHKFNTTTTKLNILADKLIQSSKSPYIILINEDNRDTVSKIGQQDDTSSSSYQNNQLYNSDDKNLDISSSSSLSIFYYFKFKNLFTILVIFYSLKF